MKLPKAREILELNVKEAGKKMPTDTLTAVKLGIEAIKRVEYIKRYPGDRDWKLLPGETEGD